MKKNQKLIIATSLLMTIATSVVPHSYAALRDEPLYDMGRAYNANVGDWPSDGKSTVVMSVQARHYNPEGFGRERIRVWGRSASVEQLLNKYAFVHQTWASITAKGNATYSPSVLSFNASDPTENLSGFTPNNYFYDILGYLGVPTDTLTAYINGAVTEGTDRVENNGYNWEMYTRRPENADLPDSFSYTQADKSANTGTSVKFSYNLPNMYTNFNMEAVGKVQYGLIGSLGVVAYAWTGKAVINHQVNRK